jgi:hypothetical protein
MARSNPVIDEILRQGADQPRKFVLAALTTGRVESNFRNLSGGDADSQGWRQERASLYKNPRNLKASVRRFYAEAAKLDRGQSASHLAADVQRPAAQFRGRYAEHLGEAKQILRGGSTGGYETSTTTTKLGGPGSAVDVAAALAAQTPQAPRRTVSAPALPEVLTPQGYTPVSIGAPTADSQPDLKSALDQIAEDKLPSITNTTTTTRSRGGADGGAPVKGSQIKELFWQGQGGVNIKDGKRVAQGFVSGHTDHVHVAAGPKTVDRLGRLAQDMGLRVGENPSFGGVDPVHTGGSYHYRDQAMLATVSEIAEVRRGRSCSGSASAS